jgi:flagellar FliL protein
MTESKKKKSGKMKTIIVFFLAAPTLAGAGVAGGIYATRAGWTGQAGGPLASKTEATPTTAKSAPIYYSFQAPFTSNLRDSGSFVQLALSVATADRPEIADEVKLNESALRSVVLMTVADEDAGALATTAGKQQLQAKLRTVMDQVLRTKTGRTGIDSVYFTSFVIQ